MKKQDKLSRDILHLLNKSEPNMVDTTEIVEFLWAPYKFEYENKKEFDVAIKQELGFLVESGEIKRVDTFFGTLASRPLDKPTKKEDVDVDTERHLEYYRAGDRMSGSSSLVWQKHAKEAADAEKKAGKESD